MTESPSAPLVDRTIAALRANHAQLAELVSGLTEAQLTGSSGASDWTVADVLSHLGSGAEIQHNQIIAALAEGESDVPGNQSVWDRWNAMSPADQAEEFMASDGRLVATYEELSPEQRTSLVVDLGFFPQPVPLAVPLAMRLNEQTLHAWDVRVAVDPQAGLGEENAALLAEHMATTLGFLLGFRGRPEELPNSRLGLGDYTLAIAKEISFERGVADTTATFHGPLEAGMRLLAGRLKAPHVPDGVEVTGNLTLAELQQAFPGY